MISNTQQKVTDKYRDNPFWDRNKEENVELDYEAELVLAMNGVDGSDPEGAHGTADRILIEALKHNGWDRLVDAYKDLLGRCSWWGCA